jgi:hypothetical protein
MATIIKKRLFVLTEAQSRWIDDEVERRDHGNYATERCTRSAVIRELIDVAQKKGTE